MSTNRKIFLLLAVSLMMSCSVAKKMMNPGSWGPANGLKKIDVQTNETTNRTSAIQICFLFIYTDKKNPVELPTKSHVWFTDRSTYMAPLGREAAIVEMQVPPNKNVWNIELPDGHKKATQIVLFADYVDDAGQKPIDITLYKHVSILLDEKGMVLTEKQE